MLRGIWSAAALTAGVALGGSAAAGDDAVKLGRFQPSAGGFAGAVKSAADVEAARDANDDTELVHGWHKHRRYGYGYGGYGYRGGYGGYGYGWPGHSRGYSSFSIGLSTGYYGGYGYGWGYPRYGYGWGGYGYGWPRYGYGWGGYGLGYSSYYRPGLSISVYSAPRVYYPTYSYGYSSLDPWCDWYTIGGLASTVRTPATLLGSVTGSQSIPAPMPSAANGTAQLLPPPTPLGQRVPDATAPAPNGTFRYDGGPAAPVPMPVPDATPAPKTIEPAQEPPMSLPISLPARKPAYKYPAYGDKK